MPRGILFIISMAVILLTALFTFGYNTQIAKKSAYTASNEYKPGRNQEADSAINQAYELYKVRKQSNDDFSKGSCLTNALIKNWVLDLAHNPREPIDDLSENQCSAYLEGQAKHFVELDLNGELIRFK